VTPSSLGRWLPVFQWNVVPELSGSSEFGSFYSKTGYMIYIQVLAFMNLHTYSITCSQLKLTRHPYALSNTYCPLYIHLLVAYISGLVENLAIR
jgi:hypothetical protein